MVVLAKRKAKQKRDLGGNKKSCKKLLKI